MSTILTPMSTSLTTAYQRTGEFPRSDQTGDDVDGEGEDHDVEEKRQQAVGEAEAAEAVVLDLHVGDLEGHADHEREIDEVPVVGLRGMREGEAAGDGIVAGFRRRRLVVVVM